MTPYRTAAAILTGGASRRMGRDKAFVEIDGRALVERVSAACREAGLDEIVCVGGDLRRLADTGLAVTGDLHPGQGPLGGLLSAFAHLHCDLVLLSCDLPDLGPETLTALCGALRADPAADVVVPVVDGRHQYTCAAYRHRIEGTLRAAFEGGERSLRGAVRELVATELVGLDPLQFVDLDTPADLRRRQDGTL